MRILAATLRIVFTVLAIAGVVDGAVNQVQGDGWLLVASCYAGAAVFALLANAWKEAAADDTR
jgi:hypothetical protein